MINNKILLDDGYIDIEKGKEILKEFSFWGRFIAYNKKLKRIYYFGDFETFSLNGHLILSSSYLHYSLKEKAFNMKYVEEDELISRANKEIDGIHFFNLKYKNMVQLLEPVKSDYYPSENIIKFDKDKNDREIQEYFDRTYGVKKKGTKIEGKDDEWYDTTLNKTLKKKKKWLKKQKKKRGKQTAEKIEEEILLEEITPIIKKQMIQDGLPASDEEVEKEVTRVLNEGLS